MEENPKKLFGHSIIDFESEALELDDEEILFLKKRYEIKLNAVLGMLATLGITSVSSREEMENCWEHIRAYMDPYILKKAENVLTLAEAIKLNAFNCATSAHFCADILTALGAKCAFVLLEKHAILKATAKDEKCLFIETSGKEIYFSEEEVKKEYKFIYTIEDYSERTLSYLYLSGWANILLKHTRKTMEEIHVLVSLNIGNPFMHTVMARMLFSSGNHHAAIESYQKAIELEPLNYSAYYELGNVLLEIGKHEEALKSLKKALEIEPYHAEAFARMKDAIKAANTVRQG